MIDATEIEEAHAKLNAELPPDMNFSLQVSLWQHNRPECATPHIVYTVSLHHKAFKHECLGEPNHCRLTNGEDLDKLLTKQ